MQEIPITEPTVVKPDPGIPIKKDDGLTLPPKTTEQEDLTRASQRDINLMWESTQSKIALVSVFVGMIVNAVLLVAIVIMDKDITTSKVAIISNCLGFINLTVGIVIGFYFSRTNHTKVGGVGAKQNEDR